MEENIAVRNYEESEVCLATRLVAGGLRDMVWFLDSEATSRSDASIIELSIDLTSMRIDEADGSKIKGSGVR